jgi:1,3-beta-glucanosyltransferase GAS1
MEAFSQAGIYLFLDMDTFNTQIEQEDPHWNVTQYTDFTDVVNAFYKYDNLAGFFIANEVFPSTPPPPSIGLIGFAGDHDVGWD